MSTLEIQLYNSSSIARRDAEECNLYKVVLEKMGPKEASKYMGGIGPTGH